MKRMNALLLSAAIALCGVGYAADDDGVMGNYRGDFTGDWADSHEIRAQVVGLSDKHFKAVLFLSEDDAEPTRVEATGSRKGKGISEGKTIFGAVKFEGEIEVGGEALAFNATIEDHVFEGTLGDGAFSLAWTDIVPPTRGQEPPADAIVLMDGKNLDA